MSIVDAAEYLFNVGNHHRWWKGSAQTLEDFRSDDPIAYEEFMHIVEAMIELSALDRSGG